MRRALVGLLCVALTGCSALSSLTGLVGSKPDISAQVGAENTKQTVGLNSKVDTSSSTDTTIKDSTVGQVDTSSKKGYQTISTGTIQTESLKVVNNDSTSLILAGLAGASIPIIILIIFLLFRRFSGTTKESKDGITD